MAVPELTEEQRDWLRTKTSGKDLAYMGIHGSYLYGLEREGSDIDIKAIYLPSAKQLVRGEALKTYNYKNEELDIEIEIKSLPSFLRSAESCDTNCIDLLHAPEEMSLLTTPLWDKLKSYRSSMYAKNMKGIVGYIKTHSKKYTNKIDRLNEMKALLSHIKVYYEDYETIGAVAKDFVNNVNYKYIKIVESVVDGEQKYLEVCGKKYIFTWSINQLKEAMETEINRYGKRSNKGLDRGIDSKSLSHALRVLVQLKEIVTTKDLKFPLKDADYVLAVKLGEVTDLTVVLNKIDTLYEECMLLLENSDLPDEVDISLMEKVVEDYYFNKF